MKLLHRILADERGGPRRRNMPIRAPDGGRPATAIVGPHVDRADKIGPPEIGAESPGATLVTPDGQIVVVSWLDLAETGDL